MVSRSAGKGNSTSMPPWNSLLNLTCGITERLLVFSLMIFWNSSDFQMSYEFCKGFLLIAIEQHEGIVSGYDAFPGIDELQPLLELAGSGEAHENGLVFAQTIEVFVEIPPETSCCSL